MKINKLPTILAVLAWAGLSSILHAAEITVAPDSHFFKDWAFTIFPPTVTPIGPEFRAGGTTAQGTLSDRSVTVTYAPGVTSAGFFPNGVSGFGGNLPANVDRPFAPGQPFVAKGTVTIAVDAPLPSGSLLSFSDVDGGESAKLRFFNCAGGMVNPSGFDILWISTVPANRPLVALATDSTGPHWSITAPSSAGLPNPVDGLLIRSSAVCRIQIEANKPGVPDGAQGNYGSVNYAIGAPISSFVAAPPTPVPVLGFLGLGSLSLVLGLLGFGISRRQRR